MPSEPTPAPRPELRAKVLELARQAPAPPRADVQKRTRALLAAGLTLPIALFALFGGAEQGPRPGLLMLLTFGGTLAIAGLALWGALSRGGRMLGRARSWLVVVAVLPAALLLVWKVGSSAAFPYMTQAWPTRPGFRCFGMSLLFGVVPLIAFLIARRGSDPVHPRALGAALGAAGGLWAASLVDLWCPVAFPWHVVLGHVLPALLLATLGGVLGARLLGPSSRD
ncbi:MAG TPA: NrsF family protein [Polyangiaceae bacterium]|nr:NrsF family protein [Polyangiaceae bacterium]